MFKRIVKCSSTRDHHTDGHHRFEHWYVDNQDYFDGCIRDEKQCRRAYRYTLTQCRRHGLCDDWRLFEGTRMRIELDAGIQRALELGAFMESVPYKRYRESRDPVARR